uniref:MFS domain-containing protein n=1 Tax=Parastrongyloides trichosuri TaxID=131310 RepID=A0A0N4ZR11_PARTI
MSVKRECLTNFDDIYDKTTHYGRYQLYMLILIQYAMITSAGNYIFISFASLKPSCGDSNLDFNNNKNPCDIIKNCPVNETKSYFDSLYQENDFICPHMVNGPYQLQTIQAIGSGIGAILGGILADKYGRKWITYIGCVIMITSGIVGGLSTNVYMLGIAMYGMGSSYGMLIDASMTLASETVGPKYRLIQMLGFQWSLALQISSFIAYLTGEWRKYLLSINCLAVPLLILLLFWEESPRWLIQRRKFKEGCEAINRINKWNKCSIKFVDEQLVTIKTQSEEDKSKTFFIHHLISTIQLTKYTLVLLLSALTVELCIAVFIFDVQVLDGNPFINIGLYGLLRVWVPFLIILLEKSSYIGRRFLFISSQSFSIICYLIVFILTFIDTPIYIVSLPIIKTIFALLGGIINSSIFFTIYKQYTMELYPTLLRAIAVGSFGLIERIGGGLASQLIILNNYFGRGSSVGVTIFIMFLSLLTGYLFLPETKDKKMVDFCGKDVDESQTPETLLPFKDKDDGKEE